MEPIEKISKDITELKNMFSTLIGTTGLPMKERFSSDALGKAAKEFKKLFSQREEWIDEHGLDKYFKGLPYGGGKFIREELKFTHYFIYGKSYYYNRTAIRELAAALKERNVDLKRYIELLQDKEKFLKKLETETKKKKKTHPFSLPGSLKDINTTNPPRPDPQVIKDDLKRLNEEFFREKLTEYVDIYQGNYAMVKFEYHFNRYTKPEIRSRAKKWCEQFNYANTALEKLGQPKQKFIPVKDEDMLEL